MHFTDFKSTALTLVKSDFDYDRLKLLFLEFATGIDFDLDYKNFLQELSTVTDIYAPPSGIAFILSHHDNTIGCVGILKTSDQSALIKRLYVRNIFRHQEYIRQLLSVTIDWAYQMGMKQIRFNTADVMQSAINIFENSGFHEITKPLPDDISRSGNLIYEFKLMPAPGLFKKVAS